MPNWCSNTVTLTHGNPTMIARVEKAFSKGIMLAEFFPAPLDTDWYSWNTSEWGTKWDVGSEDGINSVTEDSISLWFDSAWSPPVAAYEKFEALGFVVKAMYYEPGVGFAGVYQDGYDDCYDLTDMDSEAVRDTLPEELDSEFGISEQMADWEDEQDPDEDSAT